MREHVHARPTLSLRRARASAALRILLVGPTFGVRRASWDFDDVVAEHGIRHVVITFSTAPTDVFVRIINRCEQLSIRATFVPRFFEKTTERVVVDRLGGLPLISPRPANPRGLQFGIKYALDPTSRTGLSGSTSRSCYRPSRPSHIRAMSSSLER